MTDDDFKYVNYSHNFLFIWLIVLVNVHRFFPSDEFKILVKWNSCVELYNVD